jgi:hypothetical protein
MLNRQSNLTRLPKGVDLELKHKSAFHIFSLSIVFSTDDVQVWRYNIVAHSLLSRVAKDTNPPLLMQLNCLMGGDK